MGEVYRARDSRLKRDVAIKVLHEGFARDPERLARFKREAECPLAQSSEHRRHLQLKNRPTATPSFSSSWTV